MTEESIFNAALDKGTPRERQAFLDTACGDNAALRARVQALLEADARQRGLLDRSAPPPFFPEGSGDGGSGNATGDHLPSTALGTVIAGRYKLMEKIGEGGFGLVYVAEQQEPVRRRVALKIIKPGMDSAQVIARFEAERQALAMMDHQNVAKVHDAGTTESGRPFFVMELVHGVPITEYCDANKLTPRQRLELFVAVCHAIQHAHQKGIIHRDIKPSNILVALYDDRPVPKVIDFGVAKATGGQLTEQTLYTGFGAVVGTVQYMSPEQAEMSALGVDTRSDIYSLGVLLYELLTGSTPLDRKRVREAAYGEILRMIKEEEPPKPSTRLSDSGEALASISANRHMEPAKLTKLVKGELDWIVMKCLEKDRNRRYETANGFAMDVQRYLADEPVLACPPSVGYRFRKFARKHRKVLVMVGILAVILAMATVISSWQAVRATRAEARSQQEANNARTEAAISKAIAEFLHRDLLGQANPDNQPDRDLRLRTVLDRAAKRIEGRFPDQPLVEASIRRTIGGAYRELSEYQTARPQLERALDLYGRELGDEHPDTLSAMAELGWLYMLMQKHELAESLLSRALTLRRRVLGEEHPETLESMSHLAYLYFDQRKLDEAEPLFTRVLDARRRVHGEEHRDTVQALSDLGLLVHYQARRSGAGEQFDRAEALLGRALDLSERTLGAEDLVTQHAQDSLGMVYLSRGKLDKAELLIARSLKASRRVLGPEGRNTLTSMHNLAMVYSAQKKLAEAEALAVQALEGRRRVLGPEHRQTLESMFNLGNLFMKQRKFVAAEPLLATLLEIRRRSPGDEPDEVLWLMDKLGVVYWNMKQLDRSVPLFEELLSRQRQKVGDDHPATLQTLANLAVNYRDAGRLADAAHRADEFLAIYRALPALKRPQLAWFVPQAAGIFEAAGLHAKAEPVYREAVEETRKRFGSDDPRTAGALALLGLNLLRQQRSSEAEPILRECLAIRAKQLPDDWTTFNTRSMLGGALLDQQKYADAEALLVQGFEGMKQREAKIPANAKGRQTEALERLVQLYDAWDKKDEAAKWRKKLQEEKDGK